MNIDTVMVSVGAGLISAGLTHHANIFTGLAVGIGAGMIGIQARGEFL